MSFQSWSIFWRGVKMKMAELLHLKVYTKWTHDVSTTSTQRCPHVHDVWTTLGSRCNNDPCSLGIFTLATVTCSLNVHCCIDWKVVIINPEGTQRLNNIESVLIQRNDIESALIYFD